MKTKSAGITVPILIGAGVLMTCALLTRWSVGSPVILLHKLSGVTPLPPMWLMSLLWLGFYLLWGAAAGKLLWNNSKSTLWEIRIWRGCTFAVLAVVFSLVWYTLLFGKFYLIPSWMCLFLSATASFACSCSWWPVVKWTAIVAWLFGIWNIFLFFLQLAIIIYI